MPTQAQITGAANTLGGVARAQVITLIRGSERFQSNPGRYPNLESVIDVATAVQYQQLNAALALIDEVGDGTVALVGGDEGVDYDQDRDREQLINYMIDVLYAAPPVLTGSGAAAMNRVHGLVARCLSCGCPGWRCVCHAPWP